jgi:hypothetical protein
MYHEGHCTSSRAWLEIDVGGRATIPTKMFATFVAPLNIMERPSYAASWAKFVARGTRDVANSPCCPPLRICEVQGGKTSLVCVCVWGGGGGGALGFPPR